MVAARGVEPCANDLISIQQLGYDHLGSPRLESHEVTDIPFHDHNEAKWPVKPAGSRRSVGVGVIHPAREGCRVYVISGSYGHMFADVCRVDIHPCAWAGRDFDSSINNF
jgi:hypothetical protein